MDLTTNFSSSPITLGVNRRSIGGAATTRRSAWHQRTTFILALQYADLVAQHQQLGLISGTIAEWCEGEVDEEPEAA